MGGASLLLDTYTACTTKYTRASVFLATQNKPEVQPEPGAVKTEPMSFSTLPVEKLLERNIRPSNEGWLRRKKKKKRARQ